MADQTAQSDEVVTQGDKDFRSAMLKFIVETLDRPCSDGDMIEEREREFDLFIARHRLASTATLQASLDAALEEVKRLQVEISSLRGRQTIPLIDQHGNKVGVEYLSFDELHRHEVYVDEGGATWSRPTAWAYMQVVKANAAKRASLDEARAEIARLREALDKARQPTWFYDANEPETCLYSPEEVVDFMDPKPGKHVFEVECATSLPSIWCAVEVLTDEQMDERETDDRFIIREFSTEAEARAALKETVS